jgi:hypothetical protein
MCVTAECVTTIHPRVHVLIHIIITITTMSRHQGLWHLFDHPLSTLRPEFEKQVPDWQRIMHTAYMYISYLRESNFLPTPVYLFNCLCTWLSVYVYVWVSASKSVYLALCLIVYVSHVHGLLLLPYTLLWSRNPNVHAQVCQSFIKYFYSQNTIIFCYLFIDQLDDEGAWQKYFEVCMYLLAFVNLS